MGRRKFEVKASKGSGLDKFEAAVFTASCDDAATNKRFAEALKLDYPILSDPEKSVAKAYGVVTAERKFPHRWTFYIGKDGRILHIDKNVSPRSHGADMAAKLSELGIPKKG